MSITYGAVVPMLFAVGVVVIASSAGLPGFAPALLGGAGLLAALFAWEYSPLNHSYGFGSGYDPSAGYWGWQGDDNT